MLVRVIILGLSMSMFSSCNNGWSVGGINPTAEDSMYTFVEVISEDSTSHFYNDHIRFNRDMWCFSCSRWEIVRKK